MRSLLPIILVLFLPLISNGESGVFSGRVWNDLNRDGIQDANEPAWSNKVIYVTSDFLIGGLVYNPSAIHYTDSNGHYAFEYSTNQHFSVVFFNPPGIYGLSPANVGGDDSRDSDFTIAGYYVTNATLSATNRDMGLYYLNQGIDFELTAIGYESTVEINVTNGTTVSYAYKAVNTGETFVGLLVISYTIDDAYILYPLQCPSMLQPDGGVITGTFSRQYFESITNLIAVGADSVDYTTCSSLPYDEYPPLYYPTLIAINIVTNNLLSFEDGDIFPNWWEMQYGLDPLNSNAPDNNRDSDHMTDYEEFVAYTDPKDATSYFPNVHITESQGEVMRLLINNTSTERLYNVSFSSDLSLGDHSWIIYGAEYLANGSALQFTVTNKLYDGYYRTGVRLP